LLSTIFSSFEMFGFMILYFGFFLGVFHTLKLNIGNRIRYKYNYTLDRLKKND
jgi:hypothetical protein